MCALQVWSSVPANENLAVRVAIETNYSCINVNSTSDNKTETTTTTTTTTMKSRKHQQERDMRERVQKKRALALERARKEEMVLRLHEDRKIRQEVESKHETCCD